MSFPLCLFCICIAHQSSLYLLIPLLNNRWKRFENTEKREITKILFRYCTLNWWSCLFNLFKAYWMVSSSIKSKKKKRKEEHVNIINRKILYRSSTKYMCQNLVIHNTKVLKFYTVYLMSLDKEKLSKLSFSYSDIQ